MIKNSSSVEGGTNMTLERRRHPRKEVPYNLADCILSHTGNEISFVGLICNYSKSGVCLNTTQGLDAGQTITIKSKDLELSKTAVVRWAKNESVCSYKIGLEFVEISPAPQ